jgi:hypothetical protein
MLFCGEGLGMRAEPIIRGLLSAKVVLGGSRHRTVRFLDAPIMDCRGVDQLPCAADQRGRQLFARSLRPTATWRL